MLRDVNITIADGQLLRGMGNGVQVKIGVSPADPSDSIIIREDMNVPRIQDKLGLSPLADACMDSLANGAGLLYCIPVAATAAGVVDEVRKLPGDRESTGTMQITGSPNNRYAVTVRISKSGGLNTAVLRYSFDGGTSWSEETSMPADGSLPIAPSGLTLQFSEGEGDIQFAYGDVFTATTTAPATDHSTILAALARVKEIKKPIELIHIVGESGAALWAALAVEAERFFSEYYKPIFFLVEARAPKATETPRQYVDALVAERKGVDSFFVQVCAARGSYKRMDATTQSINLAGIVAGLYARAGVAQSISETAGFFVPPDKLLQLEPKGIEEELDLLDEAQLLTLRSYEGLSGWFVTKPHMLSPEGSDYRYAEHVRVLNKAARLVRAAALTQLHRSINLNKQDEELAAIAKFIAAPLMEMADAGEISDGEVVVPAGQDILTEERLTLVLRFVPRGYIRWISVSLGMKNPNV